MSNKLFILISSIIGTVSAASIAIITYFDPAYAGAINSSINIAAEAAITILGLFKINETKKLEK